jgi:hypothetical protein
MDSEAADATHIVSSNKVAMEKLEASKLAIQNHLSDTTDDKAGYIFWLDIKPNLPSLKTIKPAVVQPKSQEEINRICRNFSSVATRILDKKGSTIDADLSPQCQFLHPQLSTYEYEYLMKLKETKGDCAYDHIRNAIDNYDWHPLPVDRIVIDIEVSTLLFLYSSYLVTLQSCVNIGIAADLVFYFFE